MLTKTPFPILNAGLDCALSTHDISPVLRTKVWMESRPLSADGFSGSPATLALSPSLRVGLESNGLSISQQGLDRLGLSIHAAWDIAALNLEHSARTAFGLEFYTRSASALLGKGAPVGVEIQARDASSQSWLAHPQTFTILHRHLQRICRSQRLVYVLNKTESVLAFIGSPSNALSHLAESLLSPCPYPLLWSGGFPQEYQS